MMKMNNKLNGILKRSMAFLFVLAALMPLGQAQKIEKLDPAMAASKKAPSMVWTDGHSLTLEGRGWSDVERPYDRMPAKAEGVIPPAVWSLSHDSAGMALRFRANGNRIGVRWSLIDKNLAMGHMPATGVSGVDLYVRDGGVWRWIGAGRPKTFPDTEAIVASNIPEGMHEYLLYLPLYNGVTAVAVGVPEGATLEAAPERAKPIVFYGTSITQGGCASRPGMAHASIVGRHLNQPIINLGFSGNGKMELELADLLAEIDAGVYVLDCLPNMNPEMVAERFVPFVRRLRTKRPDTPILLVENVSYQAGYFLPRTRAAYVDKNTVAQAMHQQLLAEGVTGLHYLSGETLLGTDGEGTVDGTHPTDLGFMRMAEAMGPVLRKLITAK
jgi:lysophospholipase L1-like esterase